MTQRDAYQGSPEQDARHHADRDWPIGSTVEVTDCGLVGKIIGAKWDYARGCAGALVFQVGSCGRDIINACASELRMIHHRDAPVTSHRPVYVAINQVTGNSMRMSRELADECKREMTAAIVGNEDSLASELEAADEMHGIDSLPPVPWATASAEEISRDIEEAVERLTEPSPAPMFTPPPIALPVPDPAYDLTAANVTCGRCGGPAYRGLERIECLASCHVPLEPDGVMRRSKWFDEESELWRDADFDASWTHACFTGPRVEVYYRVHGAGVHVDHPCQSEALALWQTAARNNMVVVLTARAALSKWTLEYHALPPWPIVPNYSLGYLSLSTV